MADLRALITAALAENDSLIIRARRSDHGEFECTVQPRGWDGEDRFFVFNLTNSEYEVFELDSIRSCRRAANGVEWIAPPTPTAMPPGARESASPVNATRSGPSTNSMSSVPISKDAAAGAPSVSAPMPSPTQEETASPSPPASVGGPVDAPIVRPPAAPAQPNESPPASDDAKGPELPPSNRPTGRTTRRRPKIGWWLVVGAALYFLYTTGRLETARLWIVQMSGPAAVAMIAYVETARVQLEVWAASATRMLADRLASLMPPEPSPSATPRRAQSAAARRAATDTPAPMVTPDLTLDREMGIAPAAYEEFGVQEASLLDAEPTDAPTPTSTAQAVETPRPSRSCPRLEACILLPVNGVVQRGVSVDFFGTATHPNFQRYKFEVLILATGNVGTLAEFWSPVESGLLMQFDTNSIPPGSYTFRLTVIDNTGNSWPEIAEVDIELQ